MKEWIKKVNVQGVMLSIVLLVMLTSCTKVSHNANLVGVGKVFRIGAGDYGILYVNGMLTAQAIRENSEMVVETNDGDSMASPSALVKGIRSVRFRTGPQVTGYLVDLAKKDAEAAKLYVEKMPEVNKAQWDTKQDTPIDVPVLTPTKMSAKEQADEVQEIINPFECNGDCELKDLDKNRKIVYQQAVATKLLKYTDTLKTFPDTEETFFNQLNAFLARIAGLSVQGRTTTRMRVKWATIKDNQIQDMRFVFDDGDEESETTCPTCWAPDDIVDEVEKEAEEEKKKSK